MFIPKSDVLWICLLINNILRDKIYNCKGRCQPGHLPDFFCGGWIAPYTTPGGIDKSTERLFPRYKETFPHPPITLREGFDIFSPEKIHLPAISWLKWVFQRYHITYKKTKRPPQKTWYLTSWDKSRTPPSLPWCCSLSSPLLSLFSYYNLKVWVCRLRSEWILLV